MQVWPLRRTTDSIAAGVGLGGAEVGQVPRSKVVVLSDDIQLTLVEGFRVPLGYPRSSRYMDALWSDLG